MKIITFEDIKKLNMSPLDCYEWAKEVVQNKNTTLLPPKISMKPNIDGVFYNIMPSVIPTLNRAGVKIVTRYPKRKPSLDSNLLLYDLTDGSTLALMDANFITAVRTGAVAALSIKLLATDDFKEIGIIGLGNTARATLKILLALFPERNFKIKLLKYKNQHQLFKEDFNQFNNIDFCYEDNAEEVIKNSDVIISAVTTIKEDVCSDDCFKEGCLVVPIHTLGFTNCDLFFDKVFVDDIGHVKHFKYFNKFKECHEVTDILTGEAKGRTNDKQRIIAYNIGISIHDIYFASKIYEMVETTEEIDLKAPSEKFWFDF